MDEKYCELCPEQTPARMAVVSTRDRDGNLTTKIYWDERDPKIPKRATFRCKAHGIGLLAALGATLIDEG